MSYIFECNGVSVWSPALATGEVFKSLANTISSNLKMEVGLIWIAEDMALVDAEQFAAFVDSLGQRFEESNNQVWRSLVESFTVISIVLARRCGIAIAPIGLILEGQTSAMDGRMPWR